MEDDDIGPAGRLAGETQAGLERLAAGVGEEEAVEVRREDAVELVDERQQRLVHDGRVLPVDELADLLLRGRDDLGVAVAGAHDPDAGGEVEVAVAVDVEDLAAEGVVDRDGGGLLEQGGQRCHRYLRLFV